ncbi:class I SAM-dependent methyltransferase [Streptomyces sp. NBC_00237]|uniref:class I SAM-dependent methyltransferase n=1 Tax=Streptomyces sp. NBC_00237 TaxID=2975687 RepID=UPI002258C805|nr:class I SAM-dependent methyltransferase [Streptomyces sp. NBC_00237]MCX5205698.1 class I SAM-dependent methyltransferase [Streptomyces sp. NBC_00237]
MATGAYDSSTARAYVRATDSVFRRDVISHTTRAELGDLRGLSVLDVGCGEGRDARWARAQGAVRVLGVDLSEEMVRMARQRSAGDEHLTFVHGDGTALPDTGRFDVALAVNVLHYALSRDSLARMYQQVYDRMHPGGRLVAVCADSRCDPSRPGPDAYDITIERPAGAEEGAEVRQRFLRDGRPVAEIVYRHWPRDLHERLAHQAGFTHLRWSALRCTADTVPRRGPDRHARYLSNPHLVVLTARVAPR